MRHRIIFCGTFIMVLGLLILPILSEKEGIFHTTATAQKVFKFKFADMCPSGSTMAKSGQWWASEVDKRTGGRVKVECYWGGSLIGGYEQLNSVKSGIIQVTPYYSGFHPDLAPLPSIALFPMINRGTLKEAMGASDEWYRTEPAIATEFKKNNVKYLFTYNMANHYLWSKVPLKTLGDLKGLRIRTFGPFLAFFKELGCGLVTMPVPEVYTALEKGAVDCTTQYLSNGIGGRYQEVVKYANLTELGHNLGAPIVMNLDTWNSLPADIQTILNKVDSEMVDKMAEIDKDLYNSYIKTIKDVGLITNQFSQGEVEKLTEMAKAKVWEPYVAKFDEKGIPATQSLKHYIQMTEKYSKIGR